MIIITTKHSVYEVNTESKKFRRVKCSIGRPREFDNVWCSYTGEVDVTPDYPVFFNREGRDALVTSKVVEVEFISH